MNRSIIIKGVSKYYGKTKALEDVNMEIQQGMFGLLGTNGAGKTTLMKMIATLHPPTEGRITVCGVDIREGKTIRNMIGYLPQDFSMYGGMTAYEAMEYLAVLSGLSKKERSGRIVELLEKVNLQNNHRTKVKTMSGGMRRRLGIAQALVNNPQVLIVDEPTAGLDPEERIRFRNILSEIASNRIVILSTHIVGDIEATCEDIVILDKGCVKFNGTVDALLDLAQGNIYGAQVSKSELDKLKEKYVVTGVLTRGSKADVRFISSKKPFPAAELIEANVEDAYMFLMNRKAGEIHVD